MSESLKMKLMLQPIPKYSKGEEIFNWVSHLLGIVLGFIALLTFITIGARSSFTPLTIASLIIYSLSLIILYTCSMVYHLISPNSAYKRVFRLIDHNTIYLLIAGTYAPICAIGFPGTPYGIIMMCIELICVCAGVILNLVSFHNTFTKVFTVILYVVMGWLVALFYPAFMMLNFNVIMLLLFGGISYTIGVIFYAMGKTKKWMHSVFHLFVLLGSILQLGAVMSMINLF